MLSRRYFSDPMALTITACYAFSYNTYMADAQLRTYGPLTCAITALTLGVLTLVSAGQPYAPYLTGHKRLSWGLLCLAALGCSCLHAEGVLVLFTVFLLFLAPQLNIDKKARLSVLLVIIAATLPLIAYTVYVYFTHPATMDRHSIVMSFRGVRDTPFSIFCGCNADSLISYLSGSYDTKTLESNIRAAFNILNISTWLAFAAGLFTLVPIIKDKIWKFSWEGLLLFSVFAIPSLILYLANVFGILSWQPRYAAPMLVPFLIVGFAGAQRWGRYALSAVILAAAAIYIACFPCATGLWYQYWDDTNRFIQELQQPGDHIAVHTINSGYSFAMAYDVEHIKFVFPESEQTRLRIEQQYTPGKLDVLPIDLPMIGQPLFNRWRDGRVFLVISQNNERTQEMLIRLNEHYGVLDSHEHRALPFWGNATTYLLQKR